jgi:hypothetical protein
MNKKVAAVRVAGFSGGVDYYTGAPNDLELVEAIINEAYPNSSIQIEMKDSVPEGQPRKNFEDLATQLDADFFQKESKRIEGVHKRFLSYRILISEEDNC